VLGQHKGQVVWHRGGRIGRCAEGDEESEQDGVLVRAQCGGSTGLQSRINLFDAGLVEYVPQASERGDTWPVALIAG
jgi:hypothetical protein